MEFDPKLQGLSLDNYKRDSCISEKLLGLIILVPWRVLFSLFLSSTLRYIYFIHTRRKAKGATAGRPFGRPACVCARGQTTQVLVAAYRMPFPPARLLVVAPVGRVRIISREGPKGERGINLRTISSYFARAHKCAFASSRGKIRPRICAY